MNLPDSEATTLVAGEADGEIRAVMDLDRDGAPEFWLENSYYEGHSSIYARWRVDHFETIDTFTDGT